MRGPGLSPLPVPAPGAGGPVLLVVAGGAVSQAAIARTAELAAGAPVTVVGVGTSGVSRTESGFTRPLHPTRPAGEASQRVATSRAGLPAASVGPSPRAGTAGGSVGSSPRAGTAGGSRRSSSRSSAAGGSAGSSPRASTEPEQVRRTVALAMSVLEHTGVVATGHVAVTNAPARAVARMARACGARVVILDQPRPSSAGQPGLPVASGPAAGGSGAGRASAGRSGAGPVGLMPELRRRMYGSGVVVLSETGRRGGWVSA
jgi:hypothetical protein